VRPHHFSYTVLSNASMSTPCCTPCLKPQALMCK